jgi:hypothetical protein
MRYLLAALFVILTTAAATAQTPTDFKAIVRRLPAPEQERLNLYLRHLGSTSERQLIQAYDQLSTDAKSRAQQYAAFLAVLPEDRPRTRVAWTPDTLKYGQLDEGQILLDSFIVRNTGPAPYVIERVHASCDCTVLHYPPYPLMPGESATIRVEFNSNGKAGRVTPGIIFYDNSMPNLRSIVYLDGDVAPRVKRRN